MFFLSEFQKLKSSGRDRPGNSWDFHPRDDSREQVLKSNLIFGKMSPQLTGFSEMCMFRKLLLAGKSIIIIKKRVRQELQISKLS